MELLQHGQLCFIVTLILKFNTDIKRTVLSVLRFQMPPKFDHQYKGSQCARWHSIKSRSL